MKKLITATVATLVVIAAGAAMARQPKYVSERVTDADVQRAIDSRLHELMVKMNARHR